MNPYDYKNVKPIKITKIPALKEIKDGKPVFVLKTITTIDEKPERNKS